MNANTYVRARIDEDTKDRAAAALRKMGLSVSDAIRLLMVRVAEEQRLPFTVEVPNAETRAAMADARELLRERRLRFTSGEELMDDLEKAGGR